HGTGRESPPRRTCVVRGLGPARAPAVPGDPASRVGHAGANRRAPARRRDPPRGRGRRARRRPLQLRLRGRTAPAQRALRPRAARARRVFVPRPPWPPLADWVFYELPPGPFTPAGTLDAAIDRLPAMRELGISAVELMPLSPFPGTRNWGYDGVQPFAVQES